MLGAGPEPEWLYPATLATLAVLSFMLWQMNNTKTMIAVFILAGYIIFNHETGHSLGELRENMVSDFKEATGSETQYDKQMREAKGE